MGAYSTIRSLTSRLREEGKITERRRIGEKLRAFLGESRNRELLLYEAKSKRGLVHVWSTIIGATIVATDRAIARDKPGKKSSLKKEDVSFPYYMLIRFDEFAKFSNTEGILSAKDVRNLLEYCLEMLANDAAMNVAGDEIWTMLDFLCSRADFVAHFRTRDEMEKILSEVEQQLDESRKGKHADVAVKVFANLLTTAKSIGLGMYLLLPRCLDMIGGWCEARLNKIESFRASGVLSGVDSMFSAAAAILSSHPEHAIYALSKNGGEIFSLAKQCYPIAPSKASKEAIIEYFLAHL